MKNRSLLVSGILLIAVIAFFVVMPGEKTYYLTPPQPALKPALQSPGQTGPLLPPVTDTAAYDFDIVDAGTLAISDNENHMYSFGPAKELEKAFGEAKVTGFDSEVTNDYRYHYEYEGLTLIFDSTKTHYFHVTIKSPKYKMRLGNRWYQTGDHIASLNRQFPQAFKDRDEDRIYINLSSGGHLYDANLSIHFNDQGIITEIYAGLNES